ncbi:PREDICTED: uncharacterized protein LOC107194240 [Dufourea novaeangliae]|uniref:uncharacterized protein LOC107194240 n=1 Tax=Dufourea novaeangliae TaxID=178035 RepID=UPI0007672253|nr:PREDICTED: uncharacterized protein LOC107194240 [Dufourea novaeangliae]
MQQVFPVIKVSQTVHFGCWLANNNGERRRRRFALTYTFALLFFSIYINGTDIYHTWGDFSTLCVYHVAVGHICFDYFLSIVNLHVTCQFRILQYRLLSLGNVIETQTDEESLSRYTNVCLAKLRGCIQQHQALTEYCRRLENIFTLIILAQVLFLSIVLCLISYQLFLADVPHFRNISLVMNMIGILCMLFMFTYSCDGLIRQSTNVGRVTFLAPWSSMSMNKAGPQYCNVIFYFIKTQVS